jgi:hypothetical protein
VNNDEINGVGGGLDHVPFQPDRFHFAAFSVIDTAPEHVKAKSFLRAVRDHGTKFQIRTLLGPVE